MVTRYFIGIINRFINYILRALPDRFLLPGTFYKYKIIGMFDEEILMLPKWIDKGGVAIDAGANMGLYSYALSKICDRVEAFEPNPKNQNIMRAYGALNINVHGAALSSVSGTGKLNIPTVSDTELHGLASLSSEFPSQNTIQVTLQQLDEYNFKNVSFIKIDVEGHELDVIKGAKHTININRPIMLVEVEQRHLSFPMSNVFGEIQAHGYTGAFLVQGNLYPLSSFSCDQYQRLSRERDGGENRKYVNNFLFIPDEKVSKFKILNEGCCL